MPSVKKTVLKECPECQRTLPIGHFFVYMDKSHEPKLCGRCESINQKAAKALDRLSREQRKKETTSKRFEELRNEPLEGRTVYFIHADGTDKVKIGVTTKDPKSRIKSLQTGSPTPLNLLGYAPETVLGKGEKGIHEKFRGLRAHGEWFYLAKDLSKFNSEVSEAAGRDVLGRTQRRRIIAFLNDFDLKRKNGPHTDDLVWGLCSVQGLEFSF